MSTLNSKTKPFVQCITTLLVLLLCHVQFLIINLPYYNLICIATWPCSIFCHKPTILQSYLNCHLVMFNFLSQTYHITILFVLPLGHVQLFVIKLPFYNLICIATWPCSIFCYKHTFGCSTSGSINCSSLYHLIVGVGFPQALHFIFTADLSDLAIQ